MAQPPQLHFSVWHIHNSIHVSIIIIQDGEQRRGGKGVAGTFLNGPYTTAVSIVITQDGKCEGEWVWKALLIWPVQRHAL